MRDLGIVPLGSVLNTMDVPMVANSIGSMIQFHTCAWQRHARVLRGAGAHVRLVCWVAGVRWVQDRPRPASAMAAARRSSAQPHAQPRSTHHCHDALHVCRVGLRGPQAHTMRAAALPHEARDEADRQRPQRPAREHVVVLQEKHDEQGCVQDRAAGVAERVVVESRTEL